ncbi:hypothetical protein [Streptomyces sp. N2A]|uniref:TlpA family protein disulfide reductase n=1 Tax=Streptomyces sp. N2A TaxID=3073936 RepID=UPI0028702528|nr:hypothetical protein [Streptomyces sp. N2A]
MMETLAGVALLSSLAALVFSFAVARRVTAVLKHMQEKDVPRQRRTVEPGTILPVSDLLDSDGKSFRDGKEGAFIVAYLSSECSGCRAQAAELKKGAIRVPGPRLVSVVLGEGEAAEQFATEVASFSDVVPVGYGSKLVSDVGVTVWPSFVLCDGTGKVLRSTGRVDELSTEEFTAPFRELTRP